MNSQHLPRIWAVASLTLRSAIHSKAVPALALSLFAVLALLPALIKHNGSAKVFAEVLLAYSLCLCFAIVSTSALWLACAVHATDVDPGPLQLLASKPLARWHIWFGRFTGVALLHTALFAAAGFFSYLILIRQSRSLPPDQQSLLWSEILVSRSSAREPIPDLQRDIQKLFQFRSREPDFASLDPALVERELTDQARSRLEATPPAFARVWEIPLHAQARRLNSLPLQLRVRFHAASPDPLANIATVWTVGIPESGRFWKESRLLTPGAFHELSLPPGLISPNGTLRIQCENRSPVTLLFPLESAAEILYPEGAFLANYARAILILCFWIALLTLLGLAASSLLSFPVALILSASVLLTGLSGPLLSEILESGTLFGVDHHATRSGSSPIDAVALPAYKLLRSALDPVTRPSPIQSLIQGRALSWPTTLSAGLHILGVAGSLFSLLGIATFHRRELASEPLSS